MTIRGGRTRQCQWDAVDKRSERRNVRNGDAKPGREDSVSIAESSASVGVEELSPEDAAAQFDRISHRCVGLSGREFLEALDAGKYEDVDPDAEPGLLDVLMALPLVR